MLKTCLFPLALLLASAANAATATSCEPLRAEIEAKIAAAGVTRFAVTVVDATATATASGQVVGSCELGSKKVLYTREGGVPSSADAPRPRPAGEPILTECKDGTESIGGNCRL